MANSDKDIMAFLSTKDAPDIVITEFTEFWETLSNEEQTFLKNVDLDILKKTE